ncbi:MAG: threonylcarbamoyl-AMP synthase [Opitutales bacterium]|nr:threonylcarbamoyl-AMP synthase [Opitutales bacterium]MCH8539668.1 threonylcarbamoyl-AMP synthase [Opitutales bacterium]
MKTRLLSPTDAHLDLCAEALERGELVAIPTETVYGLAANAFNEEACRNIFAVKGRPLGDPLILHLAENYSVTEIARETDLFNRLRKVFWPGPVTFVLEKSPRIAPLLTAGLSSVAIRCPAHPVTKGLLRRCPFPVAAPSANPFGYISPTTAQHVEASLGGKLPYILDGGSAEVGLESTILDVRDPHKIRILRYGSIDLTTLQKTAGDVTLELPRERPHEDPADNSPREAPGTLWRHYSPRKPLHLFATRKQLEEILPTPKKYSFLFHTRPSEDFFSGETNAQTTFHWLSENGDQEEMGRNLYACLRTLDASSSDEIWAETIPPGPLSKALNDRLVRAAAK